MVDPIKGLGNLLPTKTTENQGAPSPKKKERQKLPTDKVTISQDAKDMLQKQGVTSIPTLGSKQKFEPLLREDKIRLAKERLNSNFYDQKTEEITESILAEIYG